MPNIWCDVGNKEVKQRFSAKKICETLERISIEDRGNRFGSVYRAIYYWWDRHDVSSNA